ncbi:MAG TPA: hypothetical protein PLB18_16535, partial [Acidobacteriota bacterium]|nr:hypothetical protein [Acidobacteriota bacterium]
GAWYLVLGAWCLVLGALEPIPSKNKERRTKNKERRTKNEEQRTKNKERRTKNQELGSGQDATRADCERQVNFRLRQPKAVATLCANVVGIQQKKHKRKKFNSPLVKPAYLVV